MRTNLLLLSLLASLAACADDGPHQDELGQSRQTWEVARDEASDTYSYVRFTQYWTGDRQQTTVVVSSGTVIERSHVATDAQEQIVESWTEYGEELGSHETGFPAVTLDALYDECAGEILPRTGGSIESTFSRFDDGLLQDCYTVDQSIEDSGAEGVQLLSIELEPLSCGFDGVAPCG